MTNSLLNLPRKIARIFVRVFIPLTIHKGSLQFTGENGKVIHQMYLQRDRHCYFN